MRSKYCLEDEITLKEYINPTTILFFLPPQCGSTLISVIWGPFSAPLAILTRFMVLWLIYLVQGTLLALSLTRIFLILKVILTTSKEFTWNHSAD